MVFACFFDSIACWANQAFKSLMVAKSNKAAPRSSIWVTDICLSLACVLESSGPTSEEYLRLGRRGTFVGIVLTIVVLLIEFVMVVKPSP